MTITPEQLAAIQAAVAEAVRSETGKAVAPEAISAAIAEFMRSHAGAAPGITPGNIVGVEAKDRSEIRRANPWGRLAEVCLDAFARATGEKPQFGTPLEDLAQKRNQWFQRTGQSTTTTAGGYLIPTQEQIEPIVLFGAESPLLDGNYVNRIPMAGKSMTINVGETAVTIYWTPEAVDASTVTQQSEGLKLPSQFGFGRITLTRHMPTCVVEVTRQELDYSAGYMEKFLRTWVPRKVRAAIETAFLSGTAVAATDPISGLDTSVVTNIVPWNAADPFAGFLDLVSAPEEQLPGAAETSLVVTNSRALKTMRKVKTTDGLPILGRPQEQNKSFADLYGYTTLKTSNAPSDKGGGTDSRMYAGDFLNHMHVGIEDSMFVLVNPYSSSRKNIVEFLFEFPVGMVISSEKAFAYMDVPRS